MPWLPFRPGGGLEDDHDNEAPCTIKEEPMHILKGTVLLRIMQRRPITMRGTGRKCFYYYTNGTHPTAVASRMRKQRAQL